MLAVYNGHSFYANQLIVRKGKEAIRYDAMVLLKLQLDSDIHIVQHIDWHTNRMQHYCDVSIAFYLHMLDMTQAERLYK